DDSFRIPSPRAAFPSRAIPSPFLDVGHPSPLTWTRLSTVSPTGPAFLSPSRVRSRWSMEPPPLRSPLTDTLWLMGLRAWTTGSHDRPAGLVRAPSRRVPVCHRGPAIPIPMPRVLLIWAHL